MIIASAGAEGVAASADFSAGGWAVIRGTSLRVGGQAGLGAASLR
jgi:hypothetical protein